MSNKPSPTTGPGRNGITGWFDGFPGNENNEGDENNKGIFARRMGPDDGGFGRQSGRGKDGRDQRGLSEGASHGDRFGRRKGARLPGRSTQGRHERQVAPHSADSQGRPPVPFVSAVEVGDCIGARAEPNSPPKVARQCTGIGAMTPPGSETG